MTNETGLLSGATSKLIACGLIVLCFAVGAVGLILPIVPGLLFLAISLMLIARFFPSIDRALRRNDTLRRYLDSAEGFGALSWGKKLQYGVLLCIRVFVDTVALFVYVTSRVLAFAVGKYQSYR